MIQGLFAQGGPGDSNNYQTYFNRYDFYEDYYKARPITTIPVNINVWQKDDGTGNWQNTERHLDRLDTIINYVNGHYQDVGEPSDPIPGVQELRDTKIRFRLNAVYFYKNSALWAGGFGKTIKKLDSVLYSIDSSRLNQLNIHITGYENPKSTVEGYAQFPTYNLNRSHFVVTFQNEAEPYNPHADWGFGKHLAHELGHALDLRHTYGTYCDPDHPDFLDDVFGQGEEANCPHRVPRGSLWGCDPYAEGNECTNNLMGGTRDMRYLSPKQIYSMHRALSLKSIRNYVEVEERSKERPWRIKEDQTWDFSIRLYNTIVIEKGVTFTIRGELHLPPDCEVILKKGAKLVFEGRGVLYLGNRAFNPKD